MDDGCHIEMAACKISIQKTLLWVRLVLLWSLAFATFSSKTADRALCSVLL